MSFWVEILRSGQTRLEESSTTTIPTGTVVPCHYPAEWRDALMRWPPAVWAAWSMTRTTSVVLSKHQWVAIAGTCSPYCPYLKISKPNYSWGLRSLKPSNENFFPVQRKGLSRKGWKRKLSSTLQRSRHLKLCQVHRGPVLPFPRPCRSEVRPMCFIQAGAWLSVSLPPGSRKTADKDLCVNTESEVSRWGLIIRETISWRRDQNQAAGVKCQSDYSIGSGSLILEFYWLAGDLQQLYWLLWGLFFSSCKMRKWYL